MQAVRTAFSSLFVSVCAQFVLFLLVRRRLRTVHNACTGPLRTRFRRLGPAAVPSAAATAWQTGAKPSAATAAAWDCKVL